MEMAMQEMISRLIQDVNEKYKEKRDAVEIHNTEWLDVSELEK